MSQFAPGAGLYRCAVGHFGPRACAACRQACSVVGGQNGSKNGRRVRKRRDSAQLIANLTFDGEASKFHVDAACVAAITATVAAQRRQKKLPRTPRRSWSRGAVAGNTWWLVRRDLRSTVWWGAWSPCIPSFVMFLSREMWHHSEPFFVVDFRVGYW